MSKDISGFDFNDSGEFGPEEEESPPGYETSVGAAKLEATGMLGQLLNKHLAPDVAKPEDDMSYMDEVETRLEVASCYKLLLKNPMFQEPSVSSSIVENEIRKFAKGRLQTLVGMTPQVVTPAKSQFTDPEVNTLRILANLNEIQIKSLKLLLDKVVGMDLKPEPVVNKAKATEPKLNQVPPKPQPTPIPAPGRLAPDVAPIPTPEQPKRRGRPPVQKVTVTDPMTGQERQTTVRHAVKNPNAIPMPKGAALTAFTQMASQAAIDLQGDSPVLAQMIAGVK